MIKHGVPDHPVDPIHTRRWSPYAFADRPVSREDLRALFEAARWAASSYNEQPWSYVVANADEPQAFSRLLSCLVEANQAWAQRAPVLAMGITRTTFSRNGKPNAAAEHDMGLAAGNLLGEATRRGLFVHQMIGILPDRARELYRIPDHSKALTAMAIGYPGDPATLPEKWRALDTSPRTRKPLGEFVFGESWGVGSSILGG